MFRNLDEKQLRETCLFPGISGAQLKHYLFSPFISDAAYDLHFLEAFYIVWDLTYIRQGNKYFPSHGLLMTEIILLLSFKGLCKTC